MVTVLFFAGAKDAVNASSRQYNIDGSRTIRELALMLQQDAPPLELLLPYVRFAVNGSFVDANHPIADGDEIAVLPPVSGG